MSLAYSNPVDITPTFDIKRNTSSSGIFSGSYDHQDEIYPKVRSRLNDRLEMLRVDEGTLKLRLIRDVKCRLLDRYKFKFLNMYCPKRIKYLFGASVSSFMNDEKLYIDIIVSVDELEPGTYSFSLEDSSKNTPLIYVKMSSQ